MVENKMPVIGVTERGDAALNLAWSTKLDTVDAAVIITKNAAASALQEKLLEHKSKCILHATVTGWGASIVEPNVPHYMTVLNALETLVQNGFPREQITIRVDPIMPWNLEPSLQVIQTAAENHFKRFRLSVLDCYQHIIPRFHAAGVLAPQEIAYTLSDVIANLNQKLDALKNQFPDIWFESCAEPGLHADATGCVSGRDLDILGIPHGDLNASGFQRSGCLCYSGKRELLTSKTQCPHGCLYCYWRT